MDINTTISSFLRDAQYRIAKISIEMMELDDSGSYQYKELYRQRLELSSFVDILYEGKWLIKDGYNHIQYGDTSKDDNWTEHEIASYIDHLRYYSKMNEVPYINFTAHYPKIVSIINGTGAGSGSSVSFPVGVFGQFLGYDINGGVVPLNISPWAGHRDAESINDYFLGRI